MTVNSQVFFTGIFHTKLIALQRYTLVYENVVVTDVEMVLRRRLFGVHPSPLS
jgi:hypothetical protein